MTLQVVYTATCPVCGSPDAEWTTTGYMGLTTNTTITCPCTEQEADLCSSPSSPSWLG